MPLQEVESVFLAHCHHYHLLDVFIDLLLKSHVHLDRNFGLRVLESQACLRCKGERSRAACIICLIICRYTCDRAVSYPAYGFHEFYELHAGVPVFIYFIELSDHGDVIDYADFPCAESFIHDLGGCDQVNEFLDGQVRLLIRHYLPARELPVYVSEDVDVFLDQIVHALGPYFLVAEILEGELLEVGQGMVLEELDDGLVEGLAHAALEELLDGEAHEDLEELEPDKLPVGVHPRFVGRSTGQGGDKEKIHIRQLERPVVNHLEIVDDVTEGVKPD